MKARTKIKLTALTASLALVPSTAQAAEFNVTRGDDVALNTCPVGDCTLRGAIVAANGADGADVVRVPAGTYSLTIGRTSLPQFGERFKGDLDVTDDLEIRPAAPGASVIIDANGNEDRAIEISNADLTLKNVSISNGHAPLDADNVARGGGIRVNSSGGLFMFGGQVTGNHADAATPANGLGGGIYSEGQVTLEDALINVNTANGAGFGGGLHFQGSSSAAIFRTTFRGNEAAGGGAIHGTGDGVVGLAESRLGRNIAQATSGGGVFVRDGAGVSLYNTNVDNNQALGNSGGGIRAIEADVLLVNTTVTANGAPDGGGISSSDDLPDNHSFTLRNTIVAGNSDTGQTGETYNDCRDVGTTISVESNGFNLVGSEYGCSITTKKKTDLIGSGVDGTGPPVIPLLTTEAFYGGPNQMLVNGLQPESPAVDAGPKRSGCDGTADIRGLKRTAGKRCDIGAYELTKCGGVVVNRIGTSQREGLEGISMQPTVLGDGVVGLGGDDDLAGGEGDDGICGGDGDDELVGGPGQDVCVGGPGKDKAVGCEVKRSIP